MVLNKAIIKNILDKPEIIFSIIALMFGLIFALITPPMEIPDENGHFWKSCEVATGRFFADKPVEKTIYEIKTDDITPLMREAKLTNHISGYSPLMYFVSSVALKISNSLTDNSKIIFYSGRICNLIVYILLIYLAIKITPIFKYPFLFSALFPMALWVGASYSADSFNIALAFLFFAYLFKLIFQKYKTTTPKDLLIIFILAILGACAKGTIYPLILLFFIPPILYKTKPSNILKTIYIAGVIISAFAICYYLRVNNYIYYNPHVEHFPEKGYFINHFGEVMLKIIYTTKVKFQGWLRQMVGVFGWLNLRLISKSLAYFYITVFLSSLFVLGEKINIKLRLTTIFAFLFFHFNILLVYFYIWTDVSNPIIQGVQGRYYLPMLPFMFLIFSNKIFDIKEKYKYVFKAVLLIFIIAILTYVSIRLGHAYIIKHFGSFS